MLRGFLHLPVTPAQVRGGYRLRATTLPISGFVLLVVRPHPIHMNPETTPEQDKPEAFALDLNDDTPLPAICELSEDGACEACQ